MSVNEKMTAIADTIRVYTEGEYPLTLDEMPSAISEGANLEYWSGYSEGETTGYNDGFISGKQTEYDRFWDGYQWNGNRTNYTCGFAMWAENTFRPKYDLKPTNAYMMFREFNSGQGYYVDLADLLNQCGVTLDTSACTTLQYMFMQACVNRIGTIDTRGCSSLLQPFSAAWYHTFDKLILKDDGSQTFNTPFQGASALENIVIEGVIGQNGLSFQWSTKLTHDSLMSIINALQDKTDVGGTWTITIGATNKAKLTEDELNIAEQKGWTVK